MSGDSQRQEQPVGRRSDATASIDRIPVACLVLLDRQSHILVAQRPLEKSLGGLWEFPGGKVEDGELPEVALRRELREELCLEVNRLKPLTPVTHHYNFASIRLLPFLASCTARPNVRLIEHIAYRWIAFEAAKTLDWAPADLPVVNEIQKVLRGA